MKKTLGVIGGMGPAATCDLMEKIIGLTAAGRDQDHVPMLVDVNTAIPDRTEAILRGGADPLPEMIKSARRLEAAGADFLVMACNTAHRYYDRLAGTVSVPVLHMPRLTASVLASAGVRRVGVLATEGTVKSGVYDAALEEAGVEPLYPGAAQQAALMRLIYDGVKARRVPLDSIPVPALLASLREAGAERFVLACTELPIAFRELGLMADCLDPTRVLAFSAVRFAGFETTAADPW